MVLVAMVTGILSKLADSSAVFYDAPGLPSHLVIIESSPHPSLGQHVWLEERKETSSLCSLMSAFAPVIESLSPCLR